MHEDEVEIDAVQVAALVAAQFPHWSALTVRRVPSSGTDNAMFRLGPDLCVRLPRRPGCAGQVEKDLRWLPRLAPHLPLSVPEPLELGRPGSGFPFSWGVYRWLPGRESSFERLADPVREASALAGFVKALQAIDAADAPRSHETGFGRGVPLAARDDAVREALALLEGDGQTDTAAALASWDASLRAAAHAGPPVWLHGDLLPGNLLVDGGRLTAVIDCAGLVAGDPATDLLPAWALLRGESRRVFREALGVDEDAWLRGRGWALSIALIALPYYRDTNPGLVRLCRSVLAEVLG
ncbi:MAG TPA: aminoglycoside phosphotransferase family protein [Actinospica sp.]|jgi:aminoglycoside phosphotransferase (APT) family kinase protein|nr:aminoglycoside phosphotransferase family protein [Actinospica sp.]